MDDDVYFYFFLSSLLSLSPVFWVQDHLCKDSLPNEVRMEHESMVMKAWS